MSERPPISAELDEIRGRFMASKEVVQELVAGLTDEQFDTRPDPDRWSMCECIDHLVATGEPLLEGIDEAIERAHRQGQYGRGPFRYGRITNWMVKQMVADERSFDARRRMKAPGLYTPRGGQSIVNVTRSFSALQDNLVERVEACDGLDLAAIKIYSPVTRLLRLSLGQWLRLLAGHQQRHLLQAGRVRKKILGE